MNNQIGTIKVASVFFTRDGKFVLYTADKNTHRPKYYITRQPNETQAQFVRRVDRIVHQAVNPVVKPTLQLV